MLVNMLRRGFSVVQNQLRKLVRRSSGVLGYYIRYCKQKIRGKFFAVTSETNFVVCGPYPPPRNCCEFFHIFQALLERTGYTLDVTTGQRKYGGPPPDTVYSGVQPGIGTEVSMNKLIPLFCVFVQSHLLERLASKFYSEGKVKTL